MMFAGLVLAGCSEKQPKYSYVHSVFVTGEDIYAVGSTSYKTSETDVPTLWKNGVPQAIGEMGNFNHATSVVVDNGDVYATVSDNERDFAILWKNGISQILGPGDANCVCVFEGDVYVGGSSLWINGERQNHSRVIKSITSDGSNIYMAGYIGDYSSGQAYLSINEDIMVYGDGHANAIFISNNGDVYVAGESNKEAIYWKNGIPQYLESMGKSEANTIVISDSGKVYVSGYAFDQLTLRPIAVMWIDGKCLRMDNLMRCEIRDMKLNNGYVYIGGESDDYFCPVWKFANSDYFDISTLERLK